MDNSISSFWYEARAEAEAEAGDGDGSIYGMTNASQKKTRRCTLLCPTKISN